ncbi:MAG: 2OG-Fe(II) oxygenase family protein [Isosphaeraceae bacterium]|nr:2OG-Fe(II) oxygenase family protein [Isosphaeraceae bacterium]
MNISPVFPTLLGQFRFGPEESASVNAELEALILRRESVEPSSRLSNVGGWHSKADLLEGDAPAIGKLRAWIIESVNRMIEATYESTKAMGMHRPFQGKLQLSAWANVSRKTHYHRIHNHPGSAWSGVYYVKAGTSPADQPLSGVIEFLDPRGFTEMVAVPGEPYGQKIVLRAEAGTMLIFPGFLYHFVNPYMGEGERISIAFNVAALKG